MSTFVHICIRARRRGRPHRKAPVRLRLKGGDELEVSPEVPWDLVARMVRLLDRRRSC
jgi:hypothetical protein